MEILSEARYRRMCLLLLAALLTITTFASATNYTGQPLIYTSSGNQTDYAGSYVDAYVYTGGSTGIADMCSRILTVWTSLAGLKSTTVDARGFTNAAGSWTCLTNPFPVGSTSTPTYGKLLLGNVTIPIGAGWVVPAGISVEGLGTNGPKGYVSTNTILQAQGGMSGALLYMGDASAPTGFTSQWGVKIKGLTLDCNNISSCSGIINNVAQEGSTVEDVVIQNAPAIGVNIFASGSSMGAVNSGPYRNITIQYTAACTNCLSSTTGIVVNGSSDGQVIRGLDNITISGRSISGSVGIKILGASTRITNSHVEFFSTGIQIGGPGTNTRGVQVANVSIGHASTSNITIFTGASDIVLEGVENLSSSTVLTDNVGGYTLSSPEDDFLGFYALGHICASCGQTYPTIITTSPNYAWKTPQHIIQP